MGRLKSLARALLKRFVSTEAAFRRHCQGSTCVFLYHDVTDRPSEFSSRYGLNVPPALFERQLGWIRELFHVLSPAELLAGGYSTPAAVVTFDDGLPGYFDNAAPILARAGVPSTIFLNMEPVDGGPFWAALLTYLCDFEEGFRASLPQGGGPPFLRCRRREALDYVERAGRERVLERVRAFHGGFARREQLERAAQDRGVHFGSHLYNHYNAATLDDRELSEAYEANRRELEAFPNYSGLFSYPFGRPRLCYDERTNALLRGLGARALFTAFPLANFGVGSGLIHRIGLDDEVRSKEDLLLRILIPLARKRLGSRAHAHGAPGARG